MELRQAGKKMNLLLPSKGMGECGQYPPGLTGLLLPDTRLAAVEGLKQQDTENCKWALPGPCLKFHINPNQLRTKGRVETDNKPKAGV
jgi:hypothetical protein